MRNTLWEHPESQYPKTGSDSRSDQLQNNYTRFSILYPPPFTTAWIWHWSGAFQNGLFLVRSEMRQVTETLSDPMVLPIIRPLCLFLYNPVVTKLYFYSTEPLFLLFSFLGTFPIPYPLPLLKRLLFIPWEAIQSSSPLRSPPWAPPQARVGCCSVPPAPFTEHSTKWNNVFTYWSPHLTMVPQK